MTYDELIKEYEQIHKQRTYGVSSNRLYEDIKKELEWLQENYVEVSTLLDYGCGQNTAIEKLPVPKVIKYDPAIKAYSKVPKVKVDWVVCIEVLEHIPKDLLYSTLTHIKSYCNKAFFTIGMKEAKLKLPNGLNAHVTIEDKDWWVDFLQSFYYTVKIVKEDDYSIFVRCYDEL